eukprot:Clim_evm14s247 gene=Clim_evmTU14s247
MVQFSEWADQVGVAEEIREIVNALLKASDDIAIHLRESPVLHHGTVNLSGDNQLNVDVGSDNIVMEALAKCPGVTCAASEETPEEKQIHDSGEYSVSFDPLDGSSCIGPNLAVGSIFAIWKAKHFMGKTGQDIVASVVAVHGPRCTAIIGISREYMKNVPGDSCAKGRAIEVTLLGPDDWQLTDDRVWVDEKAKTYAPGNLRAITSNPGYKRLINHYMDNEFTLRYTGAMVPDVNHIFVKGQGVFTTAPQAGKAVKLRLLYECAPIAHAMECANGKATNGHIDILDIEVNHMDQRTGICCGSKEEVERFIEYKCAGV